MFAQSLCSEQRLSILPLFSCLALLMNSAVGYPRGYNVSCRVAWTHAGQHLHGCRLWNSFSTSGRVKYIAPQKLLLHKLKALPFPACFLPVTEHWCHLLLVSHYLRTGSTWLAASLEKIQSKPTKPNQNHPNKNDTQIPVHLGSSSGNLSDEFKARILAVRLWTCYQFWVWYYLQ